MGICFSSQSHMIQNVDGDEAAFHERFLEEETLGQGEFGVVKLVRDIQQQQQQQQQQDSLYACKVLRKGVTFKDNTLYSPIKPEVLRGEIAMLRALRVDDDKKEHNYCLQLIAVYETSRTLLLITECCRGGEMMEYVAAQADADLTTRDVARIAYQLLSAVDHCAQHDIIHRDIKPENVLFTSKERGADLRLIDFGSGTMGNMRIHKNKTSSVASSSNGGEDNEEHEDGEEDPLIHTTFAGSAFYISPEMFQHTYNQRTDVWSAAVTLYVLVAGYPANELQKAFNILHTPHKKRDLKTLPNLPTNLPFSFMEMLEAALTFRYKKRPSAHDLLQMDFVNSFKQRLSAITECSDEDAGLAIDTDDDEQEDEMIEKLVSKTPEAIKHVSLRNSIVQHNLFLGFKKYERALTTLLAAMLSKKELEDLLNLLRDWMLLQDTTVPPPLKDEKKDPSDSNQKLTTTPTKSTNEQKLAVVPVHILKKILKEDMKNEEIIETMEAMPNAVAYENFAYHVALLREFARDPEEFGAPPGSSGRKKSISRQDRRSIQRMNSSGRLEMLGKANIVSTDSNGSFRSTGSGRASRRRRQAKTNSLTRSTQGNFFSGIMNDQKKKQAQDISVYA